MADVQEVLHAQHAELLQLRAAVARVRSLCAAPAAERCEVRASWPDAVLAALGDPGREPAAEASSTTPAGALEFALRDIADGVPVHLWVLGNVRWSSTAAELRAIVAADRGKSR